jgi:hypothetical protein
VRQVDGGAHEVLVGAGQGGGGRRVVRGRHPEIVPDRSGTRLAPIGRAAAPDP